MGRTACSSICGLTPQADAEAGCERSQRSKQAGQPVVRIAVADRYHIGQEFFRWEIATAVAGAILGINPFDQPDVEASKVKTRELTAAYEKSGALPPETPLFEERGITLFADETNRKALRRPAAARSSEHRSGRISRALHAGDYCALLAYVERNERHRDALQEIRIDDPRSQARRHLPRLRAALPALDRAGLQGRPEHRRVPADHLRRSPNDLPVPGARDTASASSRRRRRAAISRCWPSAGGALLRVHLGAHVEAGLDDPRRRPSGRLWHNESHERRNMMQLGMVGLGRMGGNIVRRLMRRGHQCVVFDQNPAAIEVACQAKAPRRRTTSGISVAAAREAARGLGDAAGRRDHRARGDAAWRHCWSRRHHHRRRQLLLQGRHPARAKALATKGIHYVDVGTSGGVWGLERGYCMMIGGEKDVVEHLDPIFSALAPGAATFRARPGASAAIPASSAATSIAVPAAPAISSR